MHFIATGSHTILSKVEECVVKRDSRSECMPSFSMVWGKWLRFIIIQKVLFLESSVLCIIVCDYSHAIAYITFFALVRACTRRVCAAFVFGLAHLIASRCYDSPPLSLSLSCCFLLAREHVYVYQHLKSLPLSVPFLKPFWLHRTKFLRMMTARMHLAFYWIANISMPTIQNMERLIE